VTTRAEPIAHFSNWQMRVILSHSEFGITVADHRDLLPVAYTIVWPVSSLGNYAGGAWSYRVILPTTRSLRVTSAWLCRSTIKTR